jgi:hypothetical protein
VPLAGVAGGVDDARHLDAQSEVLAEAVADARRQRDAAGCGFLLQEAKRFLKEREGRAVAGLPVLPRADRVRYEEGAEDLRRHYRTTGSRNIAEVEKRLKHLDKFFAGASAP